MPYQRSFSFVEGMWLVTYCLSLEAQGCQTKSGEAALLTLKESRATHLGKSGGNVHEAQEFEMILQVVHKSTWGLMSATSFIYTHKSLCLHSLKSHIDSKGLYSDTVVAQKIPVA